MTDHVRMAAAGVGEGVDIEGGRVGRQNAPLVRHATQHAENLALEHQNLKVRAVHLEHFGLEEARRMAYFADRNMEGFREFAKDCDFESSGGLYPALIDPHMDVYRLAIEAASAVGELGWKLLSREEMQAILDSPDPSKHDGIRDRAMLHLAFAAGLRVSELVGIRIDDFVMRPYPTVHRLGKGRREHILPLWKTTVTALKAWLVIRDDSESRALSQCSRRAVVSRRIRVHSFKARRGSDATISCT